jgi:hypothetical protein
MRSGSVYRASIEITPCGKDVSYGDLVAAVERRLRKVSARDLTAEANEVSFAGGPFPLRFVSNWNVLAPITRGTVRVDPVNSRVTYCLGFAGFMAIPALFLLILVVILAVGRNPWYVFLLTFAFWSFLVGLNYLFALARFDHFMKQCVRDAGFSIRKRRRASGDASNPASDSRPGA